MERDLKERVIGAIALVGVAVLVVPVFLDGTSENAEIVSTAVALPGQGRQQGAMQTVVLNRDRTEPVPSSTPPPAQAKPAKIEPPQTKPQVRSQAKAEMPTASQLNDSNAVEESVTGMWAVQLGSFSNQQNAERLASDLRAEGYAAFLSKLDTGSGPLHRVRIGPQKDRDSAESVADRLGKSGHSGQVVPHP